MYRYSGPVSTLDKNSFLQYLSGDNFKNESEVEHESTKDFIREKLGQTEDYDFTTEYSEYFEEIFTKEAKKFFKAIGLSHWSVSAQVYVTLISVLVPLCFLFASLVVKLVMTTYNYIHRRMYDSKLSKLIYEEESILYQIELLTDKKRQ